MKNINEMTELEILEMTEEDVQKLTKLEMAKQGIKLIDRPVQPELFEITPADTKVYTIPFLGNDVGFTDINEAQHVMDVLKNSKSLVGISYDYNRLGADYKFISNATEKRYCFGQEHFSVNCMNIYSGELYKKICDFAIQNKAMQDKVKKEQEEYDKSLSEASEIISNIREKWIEVKEKYIRLDGYVDKFKKEYLPISENNKEIAIKFMEKAYSLTEEEVNYILSNYKED